MKILLAVLLSCTTSIAIAGGSASFGSYVTPRYAPYAYDRMLLQNYYLNGLASVPPLSGNLILPSPLFPDPYVGPSSAYAAYSNIAYPNVPYQNVAYPNVPYQNVAYPSPAYQNIAYPSPTYQNIAYPSPSYNYGGYALGVPAAVTYLKKK